MGIGRGRGGGRGSGQGRGGGRGLGRMGGPAAAGPGGACVCPNPNCGYRAPHQVGVACYEQKCPRCGTPLVREG